MGAENSRIEVDRPWDSSPGERMLMLLEMRLLKFVQDIMIVRDGCRYIPKEYHLGTLVHKRTF